MDTFWSSLVASSASLIGVCIGIVSSRGAIKAQDKRAAREAQSTAADAVADELVSALRHLRRLPVPHFESLAEEVYLPEHWYETYEPALLLKLGRLQDAEVRTSLRLIVNSLGNLKLRRGASTYGHIERQLLLALEIIQSSRRGETIDSASGAEVKALQARIDNLPPF